MPQLLQTVDRDWQSFRDSAAGARALDRWSTEDERYRQFLNLGQLRERFERRDQSDERDALMGDLLHRCPDDRDAQRVLLAALRPGLVRLTKRASAFWDTEDAESAVVTAALHHLATHRAALPAQAASGVLGWVWRTVWEQRRHERLEEDHWGRREQGDALDHVAARAEDTATTRVLELIIEAVRHGVVPVRGARLMVLHSVHGYSNREIAELDGLRPCTIRKNRRVAEQLLAEFVA